MTVNKPLTPERYICLCVIFLLIFVLALIIKINFYPQIVFSYISSEQIDQYVEKMPRRELIGQKFIIGPPWLFPLDNEKKNDQKQLQCAYNFSKKQLEILIKELKVGNFFISKTTYKDWAEFLGKKYSNDNKKLSFPKFDEDTVRSLCSEIQNMLSDIESIPAIISTDCEGGRVQSLKLFNDKGKSLTLPSAMSLGATRDLNSVFSVARIIGKKLNTIGVNVNFAPVLDLNYLGETSLIGTRAFSSNPEIVALMASEFAKGLIKEGISPVLKHWPGHGPVNFDKNWNESFDFHYYPMPLELKHNDRQTLGTDYLKPYSELLKIETIKKNSAIMTSHLAANSLGCPSSPKHYPITFCKDAIDSYLRKKFSFDDNVVIADDFIYLSSTHFFDLKDAIWKAFKSGNDMVILGSLYIDDQKKKYQENARKSLLGENNGKSFDISIDILRDIIDHVEQEYRKDQKDLKELKRSVKRIIMWKLNIQQLLKGKTSKEQLWDFNVFMPGKKDTKLSIIDPKEENTVLSVFEKSLVFIEAKSGDFSENESNNVKFELGLPTGKKIFCITPEYYKGDLKKAFNDEGIKNVEEYSLSYYPDKLLEKDFVENNFNNIKTLIESLDIGLILFGLVNVNSHLEVLKKVKNLIEKSQTLKNVHTVLICFHDPSILKREYIPENSFVISTFSNKFESNLAVVKFLKGEITIHNSDYLPVRMERRPKVNVIIKKSWINFLNADLTIKILIYVICAILSFSLLVLWLKVEKRDALVASSGMVIIILLLYSINIRAFEIVKLFPKGEIIIEIVERIPASNYVFDIIVLTVMPIVLVLFVRTVENRFRDNSQSDIRDSSSSVG